MIETRVFVTDIGADGLKVKGAKRNDPFDMRDAGGKPFRFDGNWREDKMSEADYMKMYAETDGHYAQMVAAAAGRSQEVGVRLHVVHDGPDEVVVVKPAGLATEVSRDPAADSLVRRLERQGIATPRLVHRLDAPACGLVLVARTPAAAAHHSREIAARRWAKWYVARVALAPSSAAASSARTRLPQDRGPQATVVRAGGKASFLDV